MIAGVGDDQSAIRCDDYAAGRIEEGAAPGSVHISEPRARNSADSSIWRDLSDAIVVRVSDVDVSRRVNSDSNRAIKLCLSCRPIGVSRGAVPCQSRDDSLFTYLAYPIIPSIGHQEIAF